MPSTNWTKLTSMVNVRYSWLIIIPVCVFYLISSSIMVESYRIQRDPFCQMIAVCWLLLVVTVLLLTHLPCLWYMYGNVFEQCVTMLQVFPTYARETDFQCVCFLFQDSFPPELYSGQGCLLSTRDSIMGVNFLYHIINLTVALLGLALLG